jgi:site-specific DNA-methyltransferase (adenine-specific)
VLFGKMPFTAELVSSNLSAFKHGWVWNKKQAGNPMIAKYGPLAVTEDIVVFCYGKLPYFPIMRKGVMRKKGGCTHRPPGAVLADFEADGYAVENDTYFPTNVLEFVQPRRGRLHPTEKPVELCEYLIQTYSREGWSVLDNTMGSGTTGVACRNLNRNFVGIELEEEYFNIARERINGA